MIPFGVVGVRTPGAIMLVTEGEPGTRMARLMPMEPLTERSRVEVRFRFVAEGSVWKRYEKHQFMHVSENSS